MSNLVSRRKIRRIAVQEGVDPGVFLPLINQESGRQKHVGSPAGAQGPAQLMPETAKALGVNIDDPLENVRGGARYLAEQLKTFGGDYRKALAAYNAGPGAVQKYGGVPPYAETQHYVETILGAAKAGGAPAKGHGSGGGGAAVLGAASAPVAADAGSGSSDGMVALLTALQGQRQPVASAGLQPPAFSASPTLPQGFQQPAVGGGGGQSKPSVADLLATVGAAGGGGAAGAGAAPAATAPSGAPGGLLVVGDSLGVGTSPFLKGAAGGRFHSNAVVGRTSTASVAAARPGLSSGKYGRVLLDFGSNDGSAAELVQSVRRAQRLAPGAQIFVPEVRGGRGAAQKTAALRRIRGITVVPWTAPLGPDGVHPADYRARAAELAREIGQVTPTTAGAGKVTLAAGANKPGLPLQQGVLDFDRRVAALAGPLTVGTGTNHDRYVVGTTRVSDHADGNATDLVVGGDARQSEAASRRGDVIAARAIQVASGMSYRKALVLARQGGIHNFDTRQGHVQVIWKTLDGGNHYNHVHVGVNPGR